MLNNCQSDGADRTRIRSGEQFDVESGGEIDIETGGALKFNQKEFNLKQLSPASGFSGTGTIVKTSVVKQGDVFKTEILIDLTGAKSSTTDLDIIGNSGVSYLGQITAAANGTIIAGQIRCFETPAGGIDDIDLYSATEATGAFDGGIGDLAETALLTKGGSWTASATPVILTAFPAANQYLYLTGGAGGTAATYTAGRFLIELWGV